MTTFFLGPEGSFTHQAARKLTDDILQPVSSSREAVRLAEDGRGEAVVALENSLEGPVTESIDSLISSRKIVICREYNMSVSFSLFRLKGDASPLRGVISHPVALAQCSNFLQGKEVSSASSTTAAIERLLQEELSGWGAIAGGGIWPGLEETLTGLEDAPATTRFVLLGSKCSSPSKDDKSAFVFIPNSDRAGVLHSLLGAFARSGINLYAIKSRPSKESLGQYIFYLECAGHLSETRLQETIRSIPSDDFAAHFLGSFPRHPQEQKRSPLVEGESLDDMMEKIK